MAKVTGTKKETSSTSNLKDTLKKIRKFKVYPSAYANAYASKICAGKIKDPSGVKRKDFRGSKAEGGLMEATARLKRQGLRGGGICKKGKELFKAKGGRIGYKMGTPKRETNVQKIKKTFGKGLGMQSVIYGLDKNLKITAADPKAKFIAAANKKKKKKVV